MCWECDWYHKLDTDDDGNPLNEDGSPMTKEQIDESRKKAYQEALDNGALT